MNVLILLQRLSGAAFYLLGISFFAAYVLLRNNVWANDAAIWMQAADLPLAFSAILYGGLSVFLGLRDPERRSTKLALCIAIPLVIVFVMILAMNFWLT